MTLQISPHPTPATDAPWSEPPRAARSQVVGEAEWVGAPVRAVPPSVQAGAPRLSPGLARLLNAALIDSTFGELFMESPIAAAHRVTGSAGTAEAAGTLFGTTLPDPALRMTLPALSESEWDVLSQMPHTTSLAAAARELRRLSAVAVAVAAPVVVHGVADSPTQAEMRMTLLPDVRMAYRAPASHEGALAGAA